LSLTEDCTLAAVAPLGILTVACAFTEPSDNTTSTSLCLTAVPAVVATVSLILFSSEVFRVVDATILA